MEWRSSKYELPCHSLSMKISSKLLKFTKYNLSSSQKRKKVRGISSLSLRVLNTGVLLSLNVVTFDGEFSISKFEDRRSSTLCTISVVLDHNLHSVVHYYTYTGSSCTSAGQYPSQKLVCKK